MPLPKSFAVKTFGCQMNVYDSERMTELLEASGMVAVVDDAATPDLVVLNTCHIREKAAEKVYSDIGRLRSAVRADGGKPMIAVAGCVAQAEGSEMLRRAAGIDIVVGPQAYHRLPALITEAARAPAVDTDMPAVSKFDVLPRRGRARAASAFLTIQEGCDKFCTFCVVPYTRGSETSRPVAAVLEEARLLAADGVREVTLIGQNVNAYHGLGDDGLAWSLGRLIRAVAAVPGIERIRYTTSHPRDMDEALIAAHAEVGELMPYLHLPVQSGSSRVLKAMNRAHTRESYLAIVDRLRAVRPDLALSSDFIVGFPGESDDDFEATLDLVRAVGFAQAYSFKYSPRPGTPAATMEDQIPEHIKAERLARLQALIAEQSLAFNAATVGKRVRVLFDRPGRKPGQLIGKSPWLQSVHVAGAVAIGDIAEVDVVRALPNSLEGHLVQQAAA